MRKILLSLLLVLCFVSYSFASTWYVRPSGGSYGAEDGTSYDDAWDGFTNIVWGGAGVVAGDTLYVCGTHEEDLLSVGESGSSGNEIIIRGDYTGDPGIIDCDVGGTPIDSSVETNGYDYITIMYLTIKDGGTSSLGMVEIEDTSTNIIIDNLIIEPEASGRGLRVRPGANNCTIQNCSFVGNNTSEHLLIFSADATNSLDSLIIQNNNFTDPLIGNHIQATCNAAQDITNLIIQHNRFSGGPIHGIQIYPSGDVNNVTIHSNTFVDVGNGSADSAIRLVWTNGHPLHTVTISDNIITRGNRGIVIDVPSALYSTGMDSAYGININNNTIRDTINTSINCELTTSTAGTSYIQNNTIYRAGGASGSSNIHGLRVGGCNGVIIQNNIVSYTNSISDGGNGIIIDRNENDGDNNQCDGVICRYNISYNNTTGEGSGISNYQSDNTEIYYNLCYSNIKGIRWGEDSGSTDQSSGGLIYNNTMCDNIEYGGVVRENALGSTWKNNIAWDNDTYDYIVISGGTAPTATHNCYSTQSDWTTDASDVTSNPDLRDAYYRLSSASPCKDVGTNVSLTQDLDGRTVPYNSVQDIGAFEYQPYELYMRQDGTAANRAAATGPASSASACMNIAVHNGETFYPGDIIYLSDQGGNYTSKLIPPSDGSSLSQIVYTNVSGESPLINPGADIAINAANRNYLTFQNIIVTNNGSTSGIYFAKCHDNILDGITAYGANHGIAIVANTNVDSYNFTITNCESYSNATNGFWAQAGDTTAGETGKIYNITITDSTFRDNTSNGIIFTSIDAASGWGDQSSAITLSDNTVYGNNKYGITLNDITHQAGESRVNNNLVYNNGDNPGVNNTNGIWLGDCSYVTVENNIVYNNNTGDIDGIGIFLDYRSTTLKASNNCIVRYNICYNHDSCNDQNPWGAGSAFNSSGIGLCCGTHDNEIYYNICYGNAVGISIGCSGGTETKNNEIYNNTLVGNRIGMQIDLQTATAINNIIKNNILAHNTYEVLTNYGMYIDATTSVPSSDITIDYNCWYDNDTDFSDNSGESWSQGANKVESDPSFIDFTNNDYHLNAASSCINAGTDVNLSQDYATRNVPHGPAPEMGAYEYWPNPIEGPFLERKYKNRPYTPGWPGELIGD